MYISQRSLMLFPQHTLIFHIHTSIMVQIWDKSETRGKHEDILSLTGIFDFPHYLLQWNYSSVNLLHFAVNFCQKYLVTYIFHQRRQLINCKNDIKQILFLKELIPGKPKEEETHYILQQRAYMKNSQFHLTYLELWSDLVRCWWAEYVGSKQSKHYRLQTKWDLRPKIQKDTNRIKKIDCLVY